MSDNINQEPNRTQNLSDAQKTHMLGDIRTQMIPSVMPERGLELSVIPGRECILANAPSREQILVEIRSTGGAGLGARPFLNVVLVIDRSGSMEGEPLDYVKRACSYVVDLLAPNDILSVVTFEEMADVLIPPRRIVNKELIKQHIQRLVPGNTTNLYDGLALGAQQILSAREPGRVERLIVFTDGEPTTGIKDYNSLVQHVGEIKNQGITSTFLGFGYEYNEELLAGMAKRAGGNYYFISKPELIPEIFRAELDKLFTLAGRNLRLRLKTARWVVLRQIFGHSIPYGQREIELNLADVEKESSLEVVLDLEFQNHPLGIYRVLAGKLIYDDAITGKEEGMEFDAILEFSADAEKCNVPQNPRVASAVEIARVSRAVEKTIMGLKRGEVTAAMAVAELQKTQMLLLQEGRTAEAQQVHQAIRDLQGGKAKEVEKTLTGTIITLDQGKKQNKAE